jgi:hypothetical protein
MKNTKAQEWFLLKKNWMEELSDLTNEEFGLLVRSLYTSEAPVGHLKTSYKVLVDEFNRVNEAREEGLKKRREGSEKAVQMRTNSSPVVSPVVHRTHTDTSNNYNNISNIDKDNTNSYNNISNEEASKVMKEKITVGYVDDKIHPSTKIPSAYKNNPEEFLNQLLQV